MSAALVIVALATLGSAAAAMLGRNLMRSIFLLAISWAGVAAFFLWAGAQFLAFAQVLIYLGAISMVALFAVLLTRRSRDDTSPAPAARSGPALAAVPALGVAAVLLWALARTPLPVAATPGPGVTVAQLGVELMGRHAASLLAVGALLTIALLGAVVIASHGVDDGKGDKP